MSERETARVLFVGPLPPPVHGFSEITVRMLRLLRQRQEVVVFDVAPKAKSTAILGAFLAFVRCVWSGLPNTLYLGLSGGSRQWLDLAFVVIARVRGLSIFVHHHSFSYLNEYRLSAWLLFKLLARARHIVLCDCMGTKLVERYGVSRHELRVLSNVAFVDEVNLPPRSRLKDAPFLRLGFLSNITAEKGIFEFFSVLQRAGEIGLPLRGVIAGPVHQSAKSEFEDRLISQPNVEHVGAVYGGDKDRFFENIDVLFFPTRYSNEAEPVTIFEAFCRRVPVISFSRGCIDGMISAQAGAVFPYSSAYIDHAIDALRPFVESSEVRDRASESARLSFVDAKEVGLRVLHELMAEMNPHLKS